MHKPLRTVLSYVKREDLPPEWTLVAVGDVLRGTQYGMNCPSVPDGATSIVGMKDIQDGRVLSQRLAKTNVTEEELASYRLRRGDLLINRTNSLDQVGKVGLVDADRDDVFASYLVRLNVNTDLIEPEYLNYWLNSDLAQRTIKRIATPAIGQANLNPTELQKYCLVPIPPAVQRKRIVEFLRKWDEAVNTTDRLIAAKRCEHSTG
jgi:type I restriction enzyme S subunit